MQWWTSIKQKKKKKEVHSAFAVTYLCTFTMFDFTAGTMSFYNTIPEGKVQRHLLNIMAYVKLWV